MGAILIYKMGRIRQTDLLLRYAQAIESSVANQAILIFAIEIFGLAFMLCFNRFMDKLKSVKLSFIVGALMWSLASAVIVCTGIVFKWYSVVMLCFIVLIALYFILRPRKILKDEIVFYVKTLVIYISLAFFFASLCVFRFSYDSYMYVNTGHKIAKLGYLHQDLIEIVSGFSLFTSMLFAPAVFFNYDFSQGLYLLLNVQFTIFIGYAIYDALKERLGLKRAIIAGVLSVLAVGSSNIYFEMMYWPLSNLITTMSLFLMIYFSQSAIKNNQKENMILSAFFGMCFVLTRSENMLFYICIMFLVSLCNIDKKYLALHLGSVALALSMWYFRFFSVAGLHFSEGAFLTIERAAGVLLIFALFIIYVLLFNKIKLLYKNKKYLEKIFFGAFALAIVAFSILKFDFLVTNIRSTFLNMLYDGSWATSILVFMSLYLIRWVFGEKTNFYDKTVLVFVLFHIIIFLLRAMPLRIGFGDSGSRYFAHILPIMIYTIAISLSGLLAKIYYK
jgi:hypothetical protein